MKTTRHTENLSTARIIDGMLKHPFIAGLAAGLAVNLISWTAAFVYHQLAG